MKGIYTKLLHQYKEYLPSQRTHMRVGERVLRDWFAVLSVALTVFVALVLVGVWVYVSALRDMATQSATPPTSPMPLDGTALERVDRMAEERATAFRQGRVAGFAAPDPGRAATPVIIVGEEVAETVDEG
jgi:hypothetical protein